MKHKCDCNQRCELRQTGWSVGHAKEPSLKCPCCGKGWWQEGVVIRENPPELKWKPTGGAKIPNVMGNTGGKTFVPVIMESDDIWHDAEEILWDDFLKCLKDAADRVETCTDKISIGKAPGYNFEED